MTQPAGDWLGCGQLPLNGESTPDPQGPKSYPSQHFRARTGFDGSSHIRPLKQLGNPVTHRQDPSSYKPPLLQRNYAGGVIMSHSILGAEHAGH